ncbi:KGK domain protein [Scytonema hofmannii FACHB-248]|uniref:KGK domain protein n=1 Tax=Scytonema hofmannii FACHB-248 TaxID=1842502 RepID=A0ABR8GT18_9CYAN|nr:MULTISPECIES: KGK domain-containing protein [Nostocales]MBD2606552.1 KGK domain protein [Scytonema hofmannii FACHB-248]
MNNKFKLIGCNDDDVVSFNGKLLKFAKFKDNLEEEFQQKVNFLVEKNDKENAPKVLNLTRLSLGECDLTINLSSAKEGKECEILRLGSKSWEKGKVRTQAFIEFFPTNTTEKAKINFTIEFSPDEPEITEPESPLDDIRRMINEITT